jgi:methylated-DNA-[protein]-cysteine S-methyltransferase
MTTLAAARLATPTGEMLAVWHAGGALAALEWIDHEARLMTLLGRYQRHTTLTVAEAAPVHIAAALSHYFAGELAAIDRLAVDAGGTPFQKECWAALRRIPAGTTRSYAEQAASIGRPAATRAAGLANAANPVAIVVPCHRVVGADGSLTGYGGGIERKRWLLAHEGALLTAVEPGLFG